MTVLMSDLKTLGYCSRGARDFCRRHGLDWSKLLSVGLDESELTPINDEMVKRALERAREREENGRR